MLNGQSLSAVRLRGMVADDLPAAHALSRAEQWPHRLEDWKFLFNLGVGIVAERAGVIAGTIMGCPFGEAAASVGMVIVSPAFRGEGIGRLLMTAVADRLPVPTLMLNATAVGIPLYERAGYRTVGMIHQHQGPARAPDHVLLPGEKVRVIGQDENSAIANLDACATGLPRTALIAALRQDAGAEAVVLEREGSIAGFALCRPFGRGHAIGPVVAPDLRGGQALIVHWLKANAGNFTRLDITGDSGLAGWLDQHGLAPVGAVTTMVRGPVPVPDPAMKTFAIASQALG